MPQRIQLRRTRGWRLPIGAVVVSRPSKWGNPFIPGKPIAFGPMKGQMVADLRHAFVLYRAWAPLNPRLVAAARAELAGKDLACWCPLNPYLADGCCHADVLLRLANETTTEEPPHA